MTELALSTTEKTVAVTNALLVGVSVGAGVGITTYSMITAGTAAAGAGVTVAVASAPFWIAGACAISGVIALGIGILAYKEYTETAKKFLDAIQKQNDKKVQLEKDCADALFAQALIALEHRFALAALNKMFHDLSLDGLHTQDNLERDMPFMAPILTKLEASEELHAMLVDQKPLTDTQKEELRHLFNDDLISHVRASIDHKPTPPSYTRAFVTGITVSLATFAAVATTTWGVSSLVLGVVAATAVVTTPIGWAILGGAVLLGLVVGGAMAYYKYKNIQRESQVANIKEVNSQMKVMHRDVLTKTLTLSNELNATKMKLQDLKNQAAINVLQKENVALKAQSIHSAVLKPVEKTSPAPAKLQRSNSMPDLTFFNDHKNDPHFDTPKNDKIDQVDGDKDNSKDDPLSGNEKNNGKHT